MQEEVGKSLLHRLGLGGPSNTSVPEAGEGAFA